MFPDNIYSRVQYPGKAAPGTLGGIMDIKEVIKRVEKAFPKYEIDHVSRLSTLSLPPRMGWKIIILEPKKDNKK